MMTAKERKVRFNDLADLGCVVCLREGYGHSPCHIHHLLTNRTGFRRNTDDQTIGLCPQHHTQGGHGVAIHAGKKTFELNYGSEIELLQYANDRIGKSN